MKICVLGLDCAAPGIIFNDDRLVNIRSLMANGVHGRLESVIPPITVPAWMCMVTSQDPGSLGVYGFRNRTDYSYSGLGFVTSNSIQAPAIWDQLASTGKKSIIVGLPTIMDFFPVLANWSQIAGAWMEFEVTKPRPL